MSTRTLIAFVLAATTLTPWVQPQATTLTVSPTLIELSSTGGATTLKVKNTDDNGTTLQVVAKPWVEDAAQAPIATEIFAVPPIFDLPAGGEQTVRLAARGLDGLSDEKAYLFYIKEVPGELQIDGSALAFALSLELPLFVTPKDAKPEPVWKIDRSRDGQPVVNLINSGNAHLRIDRFKITDAKTGGLLIENTAGAYVHGGTERHWPLEGDVSNFEGALTLDAETSLGPVQTVIASP